MKQQLRLTLSYIKGYLRFFRRYKLFSLALVAVIIALPLDLAKHHTAAHWILGVTAIIELIPLLWGMLQDFRAGKYGIDILAATAIIASLLLKEYWAAIVIVIMLTGGESLEDFAEHRAKKELDSLLAHAPQKAHVLRKGKTVDVPVSELHVGDKILIKPGDLVPVDAVVIEGSASFDESSLTGESVPQSKQPGELILSGAINLDGAITAKASATAENSQYQQIVRLVQTASAAQAPFVRLADRYSLPFTFAAFALASGVWVLSGDAIRFLEVIVVATPCPLILAAPIALISGMARASRYGIIVKTGSAFERLAEAKTVAFDKTGTLTSGTLMIDKVISLGTLQEQEILRLVASLEQSSSHVIAQAIVSGAQSQQIKLVKAKHVQEVPGLGLRATLKGQQLLIGRLSFIQEHGAKLPAKFKPESIKQTAVFVASDGQLAGYVTLKDSIRPEAQATLDWLRQLGVRETLMVTGDNQAIAQEIADELGISKIHAEMLPADKIHVIEKTTNRPLVFVGDGVNDAPVLTSADVGIALGARGSTAASESADLVIMPNNLLRVAAARKIARRTFQIARQSIIVGIALSLVLMGIFATGKFTPLAGAIIQEVVDVVVIFNALRAHLITIND